MTVTVGMSVLLVGCGSSEGTPTTSSPQPSATTSAAATSTEAVSPLEGTWRTSPISPRDAEATLRRYVLEEWIKRFRPLTPFAANTTLILDIKEEWDLYGKPSGGPREEIDYDAEYVVRGNEVDKIHSTGVTTYRWSVDGDTLTLEWLKSTEPPYNGVPDEVFSRVLYMTRDFKRQS